MKQSLNSLKSSKKVGKFKVFELYFVNIKISLIYVDNEHKILI